MPRVEQHAFGTTRDGCAVSRFVVGPAHGLQAVLADHGARVVALALDDGRGPPVDVLLGFDDVTVYESPGNRNVGASIGRCANRIAGARFRLDGIEHVLAANEGANHLHGGVAGFDARIFAAEPFDGPEGPGVRFRRTSPDGEEGYPGDLEVLIAYTVTGGPALRIDYEARTSAPTVCNLTNHAYFNLAGHESPTVLDHELAVRATRYTPTDAALIPTGAIVPVAGTPLDLRRPRTLRACIEALDDTPAHGLDHNFVLDGRPGDLALAARLRHPASGRAMEVWTSEPGLQAYSGNHLRGQSGKGGAHYRPRSGVCLEAQRFPDSPNRPGFPSTTLRPGETYRQTTIYRFGD